MSETNSAFERFDSVPTATRDEFNVIEAKKLQFKKLVCNRVFVSAVILVLSLAIILFALFMPLSRSFALADDFEVDIKYTGIDVFRLFYHSVLSLSYEEMMETPLYAETMQESLLFMEQGGSFDSLSFKQERLLSSITEKTLLLTVSSEDCGIRFQVIIAALSLVSVLVISAVMMYFSGFALYSELQSKGKNEESVALLFKKQLHALWIFTLFAPAFIYSFFTMANWGLGSNLYVFSAGGAGLSVGSVFLLVFSVAVSLLSVVHLVLKNKKRFPRPDSTVRKKTALIIALLLLMISVFLPILSVTFTKNGGKTESKSFFIDSFGIVTGADIRYFQSTTRDQNKQALNQVANDIFDKTSSPKMLTNNFMHKLLFGVQRSYMSDTYIFIQ